VNTDQALLAYVTRLGDNALILGQRMVELVAAYPELEEELANANFALDYIGQARMFYTYAGELEGRGRDEDDFAFLRDGHEFRNYLLLEQPNGHFGDSIAKLVLFDAFYLHLLEALQGCSDRRITEISARAEKEIRYHLRHNTQWLVRLGDGTEESHARVQRSIDDLWPYTGELFAAVNDIDTVYVPIGCGSGICSLITVRDALGLTTKIVGVVSDNAQTVKLSYDAGRLIETDSANTFADGMAVRVPVQDAFDIYSKGAERIVAVSDDDVDLFEAIKSGAEGYLLKNLNADQFLEMLNGLQQGEAAMTRQTTARLMKGFAEPSPQQGELAAPLTQREIELLQLVADGMPNKAVAQRLSVSQNTVKYHMRNILQKLDVQNRTEAVTQAIRLGLLDPPA